MFTIERLHSHQTWMNAENSRIVRDDSENLGLSQILILSNTINNPINRHT